MLTRIFITIAIVTAMLQRIGSAQEVEIGIRFNLDVVITKQHGPTGLESSYYEPDFIIPYLSIALRISDYLIPELRGGYALIGSFDGPELGLMLRSEIIKQKLYIIVCDLLHWNRGGGGGMTSSTYDKLFNAVGVGVGLYTGAHSSLELMFLKPFSGDIGYTWYYLSDSRKKKPIKFIGVVRMNFGFSWGL
jgi:hypothetical protein